MRDVPRNGFDTRWRLRYGGQLPVPTWLQDNRYQDGNQIYDAGGLDSALAYAGTTPTWAASDRGSQPSFAGGSTDYYTATTGALLPVAANSLFSFSFWEYYATGNATYAGVLALQTDGAKRLAVISSTGAGYLPITVATSTLSNGVVFGGTPSIASITGRWVHYCFVGTNGADSKTVGDWTCYADGVSYAATGNPGFGLTGNATYIGWDGVDSKFKGQVDGLSVWNGYALSAGDASALYQSQLNGGVGLQGRSFSRHFPAAVAAGGALTGTVETFENASPFGQDESIDTVAVTGGTPPYSYEILKQYQV